MSKRRIEEDESSSKSSKVNVDPFRPFRELMIPMSGVVKMTLLQKGDKKIFLIGEKHSTNFCRDKGLTPLCSMIDEYLRTRTEDEPVDFMFETTNELNTPIPPLDQTRAIVANEVNRPYPSEPDSKYSIELLHYMVSQYMVPMRNPVYEHSPQSFIPLPNARVHWLDPAYVKPSSLGDVLIYYMMMYNKVYGEVTMHEVLNMNHLTSLYILRSQINSLVGIHPTAVPWAIYEQSVVDLYSTSPSTFRTHVVSTIPDKELFLQATDMSKMVFFRHIYDMLSTSKFFKKCVVRGIARFVPWNKLVIVFMERVNQQEDKSIEFFYFVLQRFLMDFFTCCRLLKEDERWFKNIVIYAGYAHTENIERLLLLLKFKNIPLPVIPYNPECSARGGKTRKVKRKRSKKSRRRFL
jgi:hypothetical protein